MTPTTRNTAIAIAAAGTLLPALAAAFLYPERARALPGRVSERLRDTFDAGDVEADAKRILSRLEDLTQNLDRHPSMADRARDLSTGTLIAAGLAAAVAIPAALTAIFAPQKIAQARDYFRDDDEVADELTRVAERLDRLNADIEAQREDNFDAVTAAARKAD